MNRLVLSIILFTAQNICWQYYCMFKYSGLVQTIWENKVSAFNNFKQNLSIIFLLWIMVFVHVKRSNEVSCMTCMASFRNGSSALFKLHWIVTFCVGRKKLQELEYNSNIIAVSLGTSVYALVGLRLDYIKEMDFVGI